MLKKRLIGVVTVKDGWAVQSFGYRRYLPLGKPEVLVQNLDRWGADEILVQCIDRSSADLGPDLEVLARISKLGIGTPLIYAGGISRREDAVQVVSQGADRIMVDAILSDSPKSMEAIAGDLGVQAIIANIPARITNNCLTVLDHRNHSERAISQLLKQLPLEWVSELMVTDWQNEGSRASFDERLIGITRHIDKPLLCFGGISEATQIQRLLSQPEVVAVGIGNFLNYREHEVQSLKKNTNSIYVRKS